MAEKDKPREDKPQGPPPQMGAKCPFCGAPALVSNGTCHMCLNCGSTTGCS